MKKASSWFVLNVFLVTTFAFAPVAQADQLPCTITGTAKSERITGTNGNDVICGLGGNDTILGLAGNDVIYGGQGNDNINGGVGSDQLFGEKGNDRLLGEAGDDRLYGDLGNDFIDGGNDVDWIEGDQGNDNLNGGGSADVIKGEEGTDSINGSAGDDRIDGGESKDSIRSGTGSDSCSKDKVDIHFDPCKIDQRNPEMGMTTTVIREFKAGTNATFSWLLKDESGIEGTWGYIGGAPGWVTEWCGFAIEGRLLNGNEQEGTFGFECAIPQDAVNENYTLFVRAVDVLGNSIYESAFSFTITGGQQDNQHPEILSITAPANSSPGEVITIGVKLKDASGVSGVYAYLAYGGYSFGNGYDRYAKALTEAVLVDGSSLEGKYEQSYQFWDSAPDGDYHVWVSVRDIYGNRSFDKTNQIIRVTSK